MFSRLFVGLRTILPLGRQSTRRLTTNSNASERTGSAPQLGYSTDSRGRYYSAGLAPKIFFGSSLALFAYYQYRIYRRDLPEGVTPARFALYSTIPCNAMTRLAGWIAELPIPRFLRPYTIGAYAKAFRCRLDEAEKDLREYGSLGEFFARRLRSGIRPVSSDQLVSPADGLVLHAGSFSLSSKQSSMLLEQIKGVTYSLPCLLGVDRLDEGIASSQRLYYCTIYLSPGSYHRFHSPANWRIARSTPIRGELLPVAPWMMRIAPGLVSLNQRHVLFGHWRHGPLVVVPVGATNVGSIVVDKTESDRCRKGEELGHFRMGSSVVMVFAAPEGFEWTVRPGEKCQVGQSLGRIPTSFWSSFSFY